jgi:hypothetical protein
MSNLNPDNDHKTWGNPNDWTDPRSWIDGDPWDFPFNDFWDGIDLRTDPEEIVRLQKVWVLEQLARANGGNGADNGAGNGADNGADHSGNGADHAKGNGAEPKEEEPSVPRAEGEEAPKEEAPSTTLATLEALKERPLWVGWRTMTLPGRDKPTKIPFNANSNGQAKSDDPRTWTLFYRAEHWLKTKHNHGDGIGIMFAPIDETLHLAGIDLDTCRDPKTGALEPWALEVIERFASYTEVSPSKTGVKIFFLYRLADKAEIDKLFGGADKHGRQFKKGGGEHPQAIEIYRSNRYFATTFEQYENFDRLRVVSVADIAWLINEAGPARKDASTSDNTKASSSGAYKGSNNQGNDNSRSGKAFREAGRLKASGMSYEEVRDALLTNADAEISEWARTKGKGADNKERELHRAYDRANTGMGSLPEGCTLEHFHAYMPMHDYIHTPTMKHWPASSVNARLPLVPVLKANGSPVLDKKNNPKMMTASVHLDKTKYVDQKTWAPGEPMLIEDRLINKGGWAPHKGGRCFNEYRGPTIKHGDPAQAKPWIDHWKKMYPDDYERAIKYMAHCVQQPGVKINHALFLGGVPCIGKDTGLEPLRYAVGEWNFSDIGPGDLFEAFNPYVKSVVLRINEAHDLGDVSRYSFYERIKIYAAAPPSVLECNEKHVKQYYIPNAMNVIITSNHKTDGIYLPADDRRHDVMWSNCKKEDFEEGYWNRLWGFYENGGYEHVAAYLATLDISDFDPKAAPPKTPAFWAIVDAGRAPEESELADIIDLLGNPKMLLLTDLFSNAAGNNSLTEWLKDRKNRRNIPHRLEACGYEPFRNPDAQDGLWKIGGKRQAGYAQRGLTIRERMKAVEERAKAEEELIKAEEEWREALKEQGNAKKEQRDATNKRVKAAEERLKAVKEWVKRGGPRPPSFADGASDKSST